MTKGFGGISVDKFTPVVFLDDTLVVDAHKDAVAHPRMD